MWGHHLSEDGNCRTCIANIKVNCCGADLHFLEPEYRIAYTHFFQGLVPGDPQDCWILPEEKCTQTIWPSPWSPEQERLKYRRVPLEDFIYSFFWGHQQDLEVVRECEEPGCWNPLHLRTEHQGDALEPGSVYPMVIDYGIHQSAHADRIKARYKWGFNYKPRIKHPYHNKNIEPGSKFNAYKETELECIHNHVC